MALANVDTDAIIPKQFLKTIKRTGLGKHLFNDLRFADDGMENPEFILNMPNFRAAEILITGANFGCGSSREHAPWALTDFGIRCVIAPSFADIFYNNCFKNGLLPIILPQEQVNHLMAFAERGARLIVDLEHQTVSTYPENAGFSFAIDPFLKHCLLNGLDDIGLTEKHVDAISDYESKQKKQQGWL